MIIEWFLFCAVFLALVSGFCLMATADDGLFFPSLNILLVLCTIVAMVCANTQTDNLRKKVNQFQAQKVHQTCKQKGGTIFHGYCVKGKVEVIK